MRSSLESEIVGAGLVTSGQPWRGVEFHPAIGSTNSRLRDLLSGAAEATGPYAARLRGDGALWSVVLTDHQTGGRGRLGRVWEVPDRASVAVSAAVPVAGPLAASWLPLVAGMALSRALREVSRGAGYQLTPRLKWPNDVLLADDGDRKVSGILCELVTLPQVRPATVSAPLRYAVVVGTGVNVDQSRDELPVETATSIALAGVRVGREDLVVRYLRELASLLGAGGDDASSEPGAAGSGPGGPVVAVGAEVKAAYRAECSTLGRRVRLHLPTGASVEGDAVDVSDDGALVVDTAGGTRSFAAGDVVHVRRP